jgi:lysophospholipase L1-like esterase
MSFVMGFARKTGAALLVAAGQVLHAAHRPDLPGLQNQDPSGTFGDPSAPPLRVIALGDSSITAPGVVPIDATWIRQITLEAATTHRVTLISVAVGGSKASDVLERQLPAALAHQPDVAILSVGANDALRSTPLMKFESDYIEVVAALQGITPHIGVSGIGDLGVIPRLPPFAQTYARVRSRSFNNAIARVAARFGLPKSATWGPMWEPFDKDPEGLIFTHDRFHASAHGHAIFADSMRPVMAELLRRHNGAPVSGPPARP